MYVSIIHSTSIYLPWHRRPSEITTPLHDNIQIGDELHTGRTHNTQSIVKIGGCIIRSDLWGTARGE